MNMACDVLAVPCTEGKKPEFVQQLDQQLSGFIADLMKDEEFTGKAKETLLVHTHHRIPAKRVLLIGIGKKDDVTIEVARRMSASIILAAKSIKAKRIVIALDPLMHLQKGDAAKAESAQAITEGALLADYQFLRYKGKEKKEAEKQQIQELTLATEQARTLAPMNAGIATGTTYASATLYARDLVNTPAAHMTPKDVAAEARALGAIPGVKVRVYNEAETRKIGLHSFLAVAAGSDEEAYFIHLSYKPQLKKAKKTLAICGKGITFDSGGLSIKPASAMDTMKLDMAGAAAILALFRHITQLKPTVEIHGVIATTENMPSGKALRPGDVVTAYNGKTIEVLNTDAEGRLILCDALAWAEKNVKPDYLIDIATLTGAAMVALGEHVAALMGTSPALLAQYRKASDLAGEPTWELPLVEEYKEFLKSPIADLINCPKQPWAGGIIGGLFLSAFVTKPWLHVDIAGPAWVDKQLVPYAPYGASGFGVRALMNLVQQM